MTTQNSKSPADEKINTDSQESVIGPIIVKTVITAAIGIGAWYLLQNVL